MDEIQENLEPQGTSRRTVIKGAAWAAPVVAVAAAVPLASASPEPEIAESIGGTTSSPRVGNVGRVEVFGLDAAGDDSYFPAGQTFTLTSADFDFEASVISISGGAISAGPGANQWTITPNSGSVRVNIRFNSSTPGSYTLSSNGPIDPSWDSTGAVLP